MIKPCPDCTEGLRPGGVVCETCKGSGEAIDASATASADGASEPAAAPQKREIPRGDLPRVPTPAPKKGAGKVPPRPKPAAAREPTPAPEKPPEPEPSPKDLERRDRLAKMFGRATMRAWARVIAWWRPDSPLSPAEESDFEESATETFRLYVLERWPGWIVLFFVGVAQIVTRIRAIVRPKRPANPPGAPGAEGPAAEAPPGNVVPMRRGEEN